MTTSSADSYQALSQRIQAELVRQFRILNHERFEDKLPHTPISVRENLGRNAGHVRKHKAIFLDRGFTETAPWGMVIDALHRQMVHVHVDEIMGLTGEPGHTAAFHRECEARGLGLDFARVEELTEEAQRALRRVMQLFALAESPNQHEAQAAMQEAQRLMLKYNLKVTPTVPDPRQSYSSRFLGRHSLRRTGAEQSVGSILAEHFFVKTFWRYIYDPRTQRKGWVLEVSGTLTNLEMASYVFDFLHRAADRLWERYRIESKVGGSQAKLSYQLGVMDGFYAKLVEQRRKNQEEGLVWLGDHGLVDYDLRRHPQRRMFKTKVRPWDESRKSGWKAGKELSLHMPLSNKAGTPGGPALPSQ